MGNFKGRPQSTNIIDLRDDTQPILNQILGGDRVRMGEGPYADKGAPYGWDYDTLSTLLDEMGYGIDDLTDKRMSSMMDALEKAGASNNDKGYPVIEQYLQQWDPHNQPVPGQFPMDYEDMSNGYWDAQHMGNGRGNSFIMKNGMQYAADPIGKSPKADELLQFISALTGR